MGDFDSIFEGGSGWDWGNLDSGGDWDWGDGDFGSYDPGDGYWWQDSSETGAFDQFGSNNPSGNGSAFDYSRPWQSYLPNGSSIGNLLSNLFKNRPGQSGTGQGSRLGTAGAGVAAYQGFKNASELRDARDRAVQRSDPFGGQRPGYQGMLARSYIDPNFFERDPAFAGLRDNAMDATNRKMASQGYNMSGNQLQEVNRAGLNESYKYAMPFREHMGLLSGMNFQPQYAGQMDLQGTQMAGQAQANAQGNAANFLGNLFGNANG